MHISFKQRGSFKNLERFLAKRRDAAYLRILNRYGERGVEALASMTPQLTGEASRSWYYKVQKTRTGYSVAWYNSDKAGDTPLVILLQYGHGTRGGTWVQGRDFINPALLPIFDEISSQLWKEVKDV